MGKRNRMVYKKLNRKIVINFTNSSIIFVLLFTFFSVSQVNAQSANPPTDDEVNAIAKELYCPVCENTPLDVCPTQACAQWRDVIRDKLIEGWNEEQIKEYFVNQYGDRVLAEPPRRGLNWLVYVLPPMVFIGGLFLVYKNLRTVKASKPIKSDSHLDEDDPYLKEIEEALRIIENKE